MTDTIAGGCVEVRRQNRVTDADLRQPPASVAALSV